MRNYAILVLICLSPFVAVSKAVIQFSDPNRSVLVQNNKGARDYKSSSDFGSFDQRATVSWVTTGQGVMAPAWSNEYASGDYFASAHQVLKIYPTMTSDGFNARGSTEEWNPFYHPGFEYYSQMSSTALSVNLIVDTPCWVVLDGTLNAWGDYGGTESGHYYSEVKLSSQSEEIFSASMDSYDNYDGWWESGRLSIYQPLFLDSGTYSLYTEAISQSSYGASDIPYYGVGGGGYAYFDIEIKPVPEPASLLLLGLGGFGLLSARKSKRADNL